ncbi:MAG TPA: Tad domain-containing protein [Actinomycetota bacterium]|nr:Tad domain-containing protein [Actinomycetota bacterium]
MTRGLSDEKGAVLVIVAFSMTVLLGFSAFAVDLGYARQRRAQAQNSADFAALAGAGVLVNGTTAQATTAARDYVGKNGFSGSDAQVNIPPVSGARSGVAGCVQVQPTEQMSTIFGRVFNVDSLTVGATATACASPGLGGQYAVFAGSTTCTNSALEFSGSNRTVNGGVHSNNDVKITSSGTKINGDATYLAGSAPVGNVEYNPSIDNPRKLSAPLAYPESFEIEDYAPGGSKATLAESQSKYFNLGTQDIDITFLEARPWLYDKANQRITPGLYYTAGSYHLNQSGLNTTGATFVTSNGDIQINGNNIDFEPWDPEGLLLFSNKNQPSCSAGQAVIKLNGNNHLWTGIMYAPRGPLDFSGTNVSASLKGRLVAQTVKLSGSSQTITRNESYPGRSGGFELVE